MSLGFTEIILIVLFVLIVFGAKRIPELARALAHRTSSKKRKTRLKTKAANSPTPQKRRRRTKTKKKKAGKRRNPDGIRRRKYSDCAS